MIAKKTLFIILTLFVFLYCNCEVKSIADEDETTAIKETVSKCLNMGDEFWAFTKKNYKELTAMGIEKADDYLQKKLINTLEDIFIGELLKVNRDLIKKCSWYSEDYQIFFYQFQNVKIDEMSVSVNKNDTAVCNVLYNRKEITNLSEYGSYDAKNLVKNYKITNISQEELNKATYDDFILDINCEDNYYLLKLSSGWYIYKIERSIQNSTIKLVKYNKK